MRTVQVLEWLDQVRADDWCRPLSLYELYSGQVPTVSQYSGKPENNLKWVKVHEVFGDMWFGRTVNDINHALLRRYEFVRGSVPVEHILKA